MKITTIIIRVLVGLLLLFASITYFLKLFPEPELTGNMKLFNDGMKASGYLMPLVKLVELICGLSIISGKYIKVGLLALLPVSINILLVGIFMQPDAVGVGAVLFLANLFLIYSNWSSYKYLFLK